MSIETLITYDENWSVVGNLTDRSWVGLAYGGDVIEFVSESFADDQPSTDFAEHLALFLDGELIKTDDFYGVVTEFPTNDDPETYKVAYVQPKDEGDQKEVYISAGEDRDELTELAKNYVHKEA